MDNRTIYKDGKMYYPCCGIGCTKLAEIYERTTTPICHECYEVFSKTRYEEHLRTKARKRKRGYL